MWLYECGHSSLNGPLLQAAIPLESNPVALTTSSVTPLLKERERQTLSIPFCFFLTVFSAHDSEALWVISSLMSPALQLHSFSSSYFQFLTLSRDHITGNCRTPDHASDRAPSDRQDQSVTYAIHPFGFVWFFPLPRIWDSAARKLCRAKINNTFSLRGHMENWHEERFRSSWIWLEDSRVRTLQKHVIKQFLLYSFCTILMRQKTTTCRWNGIFIL